MIFSIVPKVSLFIFFVRWILAISIFCIRFFVLFIVVSVLSVFFGTFFAIRQKRVKRLIIYSSIAQVGFLIAPFSSISVEGFSYVIFFLMIYLITSILVWGNLVSFYDSFNQVSKFSKKVPRIFFVSTLSGLSKVNKLSALSFIIIFFFYFRNTSFFRFFSKNFYIFKPTRF